MYNQNQGYGGNYSQNLMGMSSGSNSGDWRSFDSAPRDGTTIEVRCTYGVAPWYGIYRWTDEMTVMENGAPHTWHWQEKRWAKIGNDSSGFTEDNSFTWRPYGGQAAQYIDPTNGAQDTNEYWLKACGMAPRKKFLGIF